MRKIQIGIIGTGSISEMHLQAYEKNEHAEIYAICDLNESRALAVAKKYKAPKTYTDYRDMLADPQVDAVSICTWNNTHAEFCVAALSAGKNVLVEKPLSTSVEEALKVQKGVRESGKILQVGYVRRYDTNVQMVQQFVEGGEFGEIYYAKASSIRRVGNPGGWFADKERSGGGPLIDIGVHMIDLSWYLMGRPKVATINANTYHKLGNRSNVKYLSAYKAADYDVNKNTVEDMANALLRFENGASLMVDVSFTLHAKKDETTLKLFGEKGGIELEPETIMVTEKNDTVLNITPQTDFASLDVNGAFQNEINHFVDCCLTGNQPLSPVEDGVEIMKILCGIYESAAKGKEIRF